MEATIVEVEEIVKKRRWILEELKKFEQKYSMKSSDFYEKWSRGDIPEPSDPEIHGDFTVWAGLVEELRELEKKLSEIIGK